MKNSVHLISSKILGKALFLNDTLVSSERVSAAILASEVNDYVEQSARNLAIAMQVDLQEIIFSDDRITDRNNLPTWPEIFETLRQEGRVRPGGVVPNSELPYQLTINVSGESEIDLFDAVNEVASQIDEGYTEGFNSNEEGAYQFTIVHAPKPLLKP